MKERVSVPSRGLRYLNEPSLYNIETVLVGLRPLSGIKVSEHYRF